jgi:6-phosphogluconolactonase
VRLRTLWPLAALLFAPLAPAVAASGAGELLYVGPYTNSTSKGIYAYRFDPKTAAIEALGVAAETPSPSFIIADPAGRFLFAVNEMGNPGGEPGNTVSAFAIDRATGKLTFLNKVSTRGSGPCHLALDHTGRWLAVANYNSGSVAVFPVGADGKLGEAAAFDQHKGSSVNPQRQRGPHAHCAVFSPDNRFLLVADLGLDEIVVYRFDAANGSIAANDPPFGKVPPGAGVRHLAFHPNGSVLYAVNEIAASVTAFHYDKANGALTEFQTVPAVPENYTGSKSGAEIAVNHAGTVLYASNRGDSAVAVFSIDPKKFTLTPVERVSTEGKTPRNFALDPSGRYLFAANQDSNTVVVFRVAAKTGKLTAAGKSITDAARPVCVLFVPAK